MSKKAAWKRLNHLMEKIKLEKKKFTIGAHFSAFLESRKNELPGNYYFESARSCLYAILKKTKCKRIFIPNYICNVVIKSIQLTSCKIEFYSLNNTFEVHNKIKFKDGDLILLVNYFGLCKEKITNQLKNLPKEKVIVDCSQAYFESSFDCLATIYSPRKFLPVPDGGIIQSTIKLETEMYDDHSSIQRYSYLLERTVSEPEKSREHYLNSEQQLEKISIRGMSSFTQKLIETMDLQFIKNRRRSNWSFINKLQSINNIKLEIGDQVPLCYPLMINNATALREKLIKNRIFTPIYWSDAQASNEIEWNLVRNTLYLPIDHRYSEEHMNFIINLLI